MTRPIANLQAAARLLEALQRHGLSHVVLCPGSRSGPLALAAGGLARAGLLTLTTAVDERSAAFFALGSATAQGCATAVITTSGTAVANVLPAAVEADRSCQPLLLITADRPRRLKECGANQTVNQEVFLRPVCRWFAAGPDTGLAHASAAELQQLADQTWHHAHAWPGPVHLNVAFDEPLHPSAEAQQTFWQSFMAARGSGIAAPTATAPTATAPTDAASIAPAPTLRLDPALPGVIVVGPWRGLAPNRAAFGDALRRWQQRTGWPVLVDPLAAVPADLPGQVRGWDLLLPNQLPLPEGVRQDQLQVLRLGPLPASRRLEAWLQGCSGPQLLISEGEPRGLDPLQQAQQWCGGLARWMQQCLEPIDLAFADSPAAALSRALCASWVQRDQQVIAWLQQRLAPTGAVTEPALMQLLAQTLPPHLPLMLAASSPVRDWQAFALADPGPRQCISFRGASGIDGTLSLGFGLAAAQECTLLLTGDLALLHDSNGWLHGGGGRGGALPLVVLLIDNGGGGIFQQLPVPAAPAEAFEQLFAMPQQVDPLALAAAHGVPGRQIACLDDLPLALEWALAQSGPVLLRVCTDRSADAALRVALRQEVQQLTMASSLDPP
ncbi:MAG: 2-succinyl-5-enolpyruvyl-6-hydroxy-3-cyclohexene-1-carboxylic-acid synthase [Synechococcus sp.]